MRSTHLSHQLCRVDQHDYVLGMRKVCGWNIFAVDGGQEAFGFCLFIEYVKQFIAADLLFTQEIMLGGTQQREISDTVQEYPGKQAVILQA